METLKKIGLGILAILAGLLAFFKLGSNKNKEVLKENERVNGKVDAIEEEVQERLEEIKIEEKKIKHLEKRKKEVEDEEDTDSNIDYINNRY